MAPDAETSGGYTEAEVAVATALGMRLGHTFAALGPKMVPGPNTLSIARDLLEALGQQGYVLTQTHETYSGFCLICDEPWPCTVVADNCSSSERP